MPGSEKRITSPEQLNDYIRVTSPGVWIILSSILVFLVGFFFWIFNGKLEVSFSSYIYTDNGKNSYAFLPIDKASKLKNGTSVRLFENNAEGIVKSVDLTAVSYKEISDITGENNALIMGINPNDRLMTVAMNFQDAPKEISQAVFVVETVRPLSFLLRQR